MVNKCAGISEHFSYRIPPTSPPPGVSRCLISIHPCLAACDEGPGICAYLITFCSIVLIFITLPVSLCFAVKVVQEYERVVIFRLGRLLSGGARGPGIFFIVPCVDSYQKVDMRTLTFDVPPQEVSYVLRSDVYVRNDVSHAPAAKRARRQDSHDSSPMNLHFSVQCICCGAWAGPTLDWVSPRSRVPSAVFQLLSRDRYAPKLVEYDIDWMRARERASGPGSICHLNIGCICRRDPGA